MSLWLDCPVGLSEQTDKTLSTRLPKLERQGGGAAAQIRALMDGKDPVDQQHAYQQAIQAVLWKGRKPDGVLRGCSAEIGGRRMNGESYADWQHPSRVNNHASVSEELVGIVHKILVSAECAHGVVIVLDDSPRLDHGSEPWHDPDHPLEGLHFEVERGGIHETAPPCVYDPMNAQTHKHVIWVSPRVSLNDPLHFLFVVAHEVRHALQANQCFALSRATNFLAYALSYLPGERKWCWSDLPAELDADLYAWRTLRAIVGNESADTYIEYQAVSGKSPERIRAVQRFGLQRPLDPRAETAAFIRMHWAGLKEVQENYPQYAVFAIPLAQVFSQLEGDE